MKKIRAGLTKWGKKVQKWIEECYKRRILIIIVAITIVIVTVFIIIAYFAGETKEKILSQISTTPTEASTEAPTEVPTEPPTEVPTEDPTDEVEDPVGIIPTGQGLVVPCDLLPGSTWSWGVFKTTEGFEYRQYSKKYGLEAIYLVPKEMSECTTIKSDISQYGLILLGDLPSGKTRLYIYWNSSEILMDYNQEAMTQKGAITASNGKFAIHAEHGKIYYLEGNYRVITGNGTCGTVTNGKRKISLQEEGILLEGMLNLI